MFQIMDILSVEKIMKLINILNFQFNQDGELHENKLNTLNYDKNMITSYTHNTWAYNCTYMYYISLINQSVWSF